VTQHDPNPIPPDGLSITITPLPPPLTKEQVEVAGGTSEADIASAYGFPIPTIVGRPASTAGGFNPNPFDLSQSTSPLSGVADPKLLGSGYTGVADQAKLTLYEQAKAGLSPIGDTLAGAATAIVTVGNATTNALTTTVNSVLGAVTDVLSGKILINAATELLSTAEKLVAMVGEAAYQNALGFLEAFKGLNNILDIATTIANDVGNNIAQLGNNLKSLLSLDMDALSWPDINWNRIKSLVDTDSFYKIGENIGSFLGGIKLPIGLTVGQIGDLLTSSAGKEAALKQLEAYKNGLIDLGTQALDNLNAQIKSFNNTILGITKKFESLSGMFNNLSTRLDPLREREANKLIYGIVKDPKSIKNEVLASWNFSTQPTAEEPPRNPIP